MRNSQKIYPRIARIFANIAQFFSFSRKIAQFADSSIDRIDGLIAAELGVLALICYVRTLAPDVLYGDSAEFQALSYAMGITHTSGYPVYLLLGKLLSNALPFGNFAYRINLLSAVYAAGTLSGLYLAARQITSNRTGPFLAGLALGISATFWSQAVIAEVYTLATLVLAWSIFFLLHWQVDPARNGRWLLATLLLLGLAIHTVVELVVPAVGILIVWTLWAKRLPARVWWRSIGMAAAGGAIGAAIFFLAFFVCDTLVNPPISFLNVTLIPSRSLWGANLADLDSYIKRLYNTVVPLQWGGALFSGDPKFMEKEFATYWNALSGLDFTPLMLAGCGLGLVVTFFRKPGAAVFMLLAYATTTFYIINYKVSSKFVFYLATYIFIAILVGAGMGFLLEKVREWLAARTRPWVFGLVYALLMLGLAFVIISPAAGSRWQAIQAGRATFFTDDEYTYPFKNLGEPRVRAGEILKAVPDNALLLMDWRELYTSVYLANVEQNRSGIVFREASPYPSNGKLPDTLIQEVNAELKAGRPVYAQRMYENLRQNFSIRIQSGGMVQLMQK
jgi:hypothetical protein